MVFPGHTTAEWSIAVSVFAIGGPFGAILAGTVSNKSGRRGAIIVNTWLYLIGGLLFALAPSVLWLIPARFLIGFACGYVTGTSCCVGGVIFFCPCSRLWPFPELALALASAGIR